MSIHSSNIMISKAGSQEQQQFYQFKRKDITKHF